MNRHPRASVKAWPLLRNSKVAGKLYVTLTPATIIHFDLPNSKFFCRYLTPLWVDMHVYVKSDANYFRADVLNINKITLNLSVTFV